jgi:spermidine/putrescine transport system permease protein
VAEAVAQRRPGLGAWFFFLPLLLWLALFVVAPTLLLVAISFAERDALGRIVWNLTFDNYLRAFDWVWIKILLTSVWYAFLTTVICVILGYPVAYFIGRSPERWRNLLLILVMIPFWTSFLIRTYAWITILSRDGILNGLLLSAQIIPQPVTFLYTPFSVVLGLVYTYLPFMILPIYSSVEKMDGAMLEAAYDLGANTLHAFSKVVIPLTRPGIVAGILLVFVPSIAMFAVTTLMGGGTNPTIGEVIQNQFTRARNQPFGAALGTLLLALFLFSLWLSRFRRNPGED